MNTIRSAPGILLPSCLRTFTVGVASVLCGWFLNACGQKPAGVTDADEPHLATNGTVEVTAKLVEIPEGAISKRDLYDYATVLKYQVLKVHRGAVEGDTRDIHLGTEGWQPVPLPEQPPNQAREGAQLPPGDPANFADVACWNISI